MTGDKVGFRAATAVDIAAFAKRHNLTPDQTNALFDKISSGVEIISGGNRTIQRELDEATRKYVTGPDTPEARKALEDSYKKHATTPEAQKAAVDTPKAIIAATEQTQAKVVKAEAREDVATQRSADDAAALAALAAPTPKKDPPVIDAKPTDAKKPQQPLKPT